MPRIFAILLPAVSVLVACSDSVRDTDGNRRIDTAAPRDAAVAVDAVDGADANSGAPILPRPSGACPEFRAGTLTFNPAGGQRTVTVTMNEAVAATKSGPLIFYWHATGSSVAEAQVGLPLAEITAVGGIVVAPHDVPMAGVFPWLNNLERHDDLFDEVVGCALAKTRIDSRHIHSVGFSAGALMTTHLSFARADTLASVATYSGGANQDFVVPHHKFAAMIMTGGRSDIVVQNFFTSSQQWQTTLKKAGHFTLFCDHGGAHTIPRALVPGVWRFFLDHPYGQTTSPYAGKPPADITPPCVE
jgi:poly(3-hydroxybutyrate) depolymerase